MNYIVKNGKNFMAISNNIEADYHKHWLLQVFIGSQKDFNIEVEGQLISCSAIIVNMDKQHKFDAKGESYFTMLVDPTTKLGCVLRSLLKDNPFYVFTSKKVIIMQKDLKNVIQENNYTRLLCFVETIISQIDDINVKEFDIRVIKVLSLLDDCIHEDELHQTEHFSKQVYLSKSRLSHLFKDETGIPLKSYIVLHKLQTAYELIFRGENITTAALSAGFNSPSHFAYTNKVMTAMTATNIIRDSEFLKVF